MFKHCNAWCRFLIFNVQSFYQQNREKYAKKQHHIQGTSILWCSFCKEVRNRLKYLIYHINITDVFSMFRSKNHYNIIISGICVKQKIRAIQQPKCNSHRQLETYLFLFLAHYHYNLSILISYISTFRQHLGYGYGSLLTVRLGEVITYMWDLQKKNQERGNKQNVLILALSKPHKIGWLFCIFPNSIL